MRRMHNRIFPSDNKFNNFLNDLMGGMPLEDIVDKHGVRLYDPIGLLEQIIITGLPVVSDVDLKRLWEYHFAIGDAARLRKLTQKEEKTDDTTD